jgi:hypothetical protein
MIVQDYLRINAGVVAVDEERRTLDRDVTEIKRFGFHTASPAGWTLLPRLRISGEFLTGRCDRCTGAPRGICSTDPRLPGIGRP